MRIVLLITTVVLLTQALQAQDVRIRLNNSSFEGNAQDATTPVGWQPCALGSTPDILPGHFGVFNEASEGDTYIGLITRKDGSFESIGQRLKRTLEPSECYTFNLDLAHSDTYANYSDVLKLRIYGGTTRCESEQLLFESESIEHTDWKTYKVQFSPKEKINYIIIEAHYKDGKFSSKGNILIDNITTIRTCIRA